MFGWFKRKPKPQPADDGVVVTHPPLIPFCWPKGGVITAIDELVLALPVALFDNDRPMSEFIFGSADMQLNMPPDSDTFFVRLKTGMSLSLAKSCECYIVADDKNLRRLKLKQPPADG